MSKEAAIVSSCYKVQGPVPVAIVGLVGCWFLVCGLDVAVGLPACWSLAPNAPLPPSNCWFLDLPHGLRRIIYVHAGLHINSRIKSRNHRSGEDGSISTSRALMLTCRVVHAESSLLFYSTNSFIIRFHRSGDLEGLRVLRPSLLHALTSLTVQLNVADGHLDPRHAPANCPESDDDLLQASSPFAQCLLSEWENTAHDISSHTKSSTLSFGLICDVADIKTAQLVVAPLRYFRPLFACQIRLTPSPRSVPGLQQIARDAVMQAEGRQISSSQFNYARLPFELRTRVLECTDLVMPLNKVEWAFGYGRNRGYRLPLEKSGHGWKVCEPPYDACHPKTHQLSRLRKCRLGIGNECVHYASRWGRGPENKFECWRCDHYACQFRDCWDARKRQGQKRWSCFCQRQHAALTSACQCWAPPLPMFLVSRSFRHDCNQIFFGKNRFSIKISRAASRYIEGEIARPLRYPESVYLSDVVPVTVLKYMQSLKFEFLSFHDWPSAHQPPSAAKSLPEEHEDWLNTINRTIGDGGFEHQLPSLLLDVPVFNPLPEFDSLFPRHVLPSEKSYSADRVIDTVRSYVATFWPPLLHVSQTNPPRVILAYIHSELLIVGYFMHPGHPYQEESSMYEPPQFRSDRDRAALNRERVVAGLNGGKLDLTSDGRWVEGIWVVFRDPVDDGYQAILSLSFEESHCWILTVSGSWAASFLEWFPLATFVTQQLKDCLYADPSIAIHWTQFSMLLKRHGFR